MNEVNVGKRVSNGMFKRFLKRRELITFGLLVIVLVICMLLSSNFRDLPYIFKQATKMIELGMTSLTMTLIVVAGMIDMSVPSIMCCAATMTGLAYQGGVSFPAALVIGLITGALLGLINGVLISMAKLPAMIVTIGTMNVYRGISQIFIGDQSLKDFPEWFNGLEKHAIFNIGEAKFSLTLAIFVILSIITYLILHRSGIGRKIYAIGTNEQAAVYCGVHVNRIKLGLFIASGIVAALAGLLTMSRLTLVRYDMNLNKEVDVVIMVLLGGTDINGGRGSIIGTFLSVILVIILKTGLIVANITADAQMFVTGLILLVSIIVPNIIELLKLRKDR